MNKTDENKNLAADRSEAVETTGNFRPPARATSRLKIAAGILMLMAVGGSFTFFLDGGIAAAETNDKQPRPAQKQPQVKGPNTAQENAAPTEPAQAGSTVESLFFEHASKGGAGACSDLYTALGKTITLGSTFAVQTQSATTDPAQHSLQGVMGMNFNNPNDYVGPASGVILAVPTAKGCEGNMVKVVPLPKSCAAAQSTLPEGSSRQTPLLGMDVFALPGGSQAMFMPAASGCVVVTVARM